MDINQQLKFETILWAAATVIFILTGSLLLATIARGVAKAFRLSEGEQRKVFWGFFFASPWIIGFIIFVVGPAVASLYYSFNDYKLGGIPKWIGLENYQELLRGEGAAGRRFHQAMYNSLYYAMIGVPLQMLASLAMAMLLNNNVKGIRVFRLIFYMPVILAGGPAILLAWRYMLGSNQGFVNVSLKNFADSFFLFDWFYRGTIFLVEGFNGFYSGIMRGDAIGPFKFVLPALFGLLALLWLARGDWHIGKRQGAQRIAEIFGLIVGGALLIGVIAQSPVDMGLGNNRLSLITNYLTLQSSITQPANLDYLNEGFAAEAMSVMWLYGAVLVTMLALVVINERSERARKIVLYGGLLFFGIFLVGALLDTGRFFQAYETIAQLDGKPNYHFALFRQATGTIPENERVPLWLTSELWAKPALILITMWSSGAGMLIFLAALKGVPKQLYEAAEVDGANRTQRFFKITLPMISPALFYNLVIGMIAALQTFESIYILQRPENVDSLSSAAFFLFQRTFQQLAIGSGSAVSWILAVIIVILTVFQFRYSSWVHYE
jgi:ABC-type sugar transport system permease subunit